VRSDRCPQGPRARYGGRFDTHWDFVRYAQQQGLDLDFTTPPKRPDRKLPPLFGE
jgi:hypothetical protein